MLLRRCLLAIALATFAIPTVPAHAGGPKRLSAALEALRTSQKQLEDAKEPPPGLHEKSLAAVEKAIAAVEKEIQAYNDAGAKAKAKAAEPKPDSKAAPAKPATPAKPAAPKPAKPVAKPADETVD